jgi:hypothetical protein
MKLGSLSFVIALAIAASPVARVTAQVQTNVPEVVSGAKGCGTGDAAQAKPGPIECAIFLGSHMAEKELGF